MATKGNKVDLATFMKWGKMVLLARRRSTMGNMCVNLFGAKFVSAIKTLYFGIQTAKSLLRSQSNRILGEQAL